MISVMFYNNVIGVNECSDWCDVLFAEDDHELRPVVRAVQQDAGREGPPPWG